ncbi:MAG: ribonuclease J, partial [Slackia sp.]
MNSEHINGGAGADTAADKGSRSHGDRRNSHGQSQGQAQSRAASNEGSREQRSSRSRRRTTSLKSFTLDHKRPLITPEGQG